MYKTFTLMVIAGCTISMLTGCGVPQEEHDQKVTQLKLERQESEDKLNIKIGELDSLLKSEKAKLRNARIELDEVSDKVKSLQQKNVTVSKSLAEEQGKATKLETDLTSLKGKYVTAQDQVAEVEEKYAALVDDHKVLKRRFSQFEKNIRSLGGSPPAQVATQAKTAVTAPTAKTTAVATTTKKSDNDLALDILNSMSTQ